MTSLAGVISIAISLFLASSLPWSVAFQVKLYAGIGAGLFTFMPFADFEISDVPDDKLVELKFISLNEYELVLLR